MRVMIVVTHLLGTGHLSRALTLGRAFAAAGHVVRVVSGGMPAGQLNAGGVEFVQLPPLRSDGVDFSRLLTTTGAVADEGFLSDRTAALIDAFSDFAPDVLMTELFPFGRRSLRAEFLALLEAGRASSPRPLVLCSIRDILAPPSKPAKVDETDRIIGMYYDAVLVHSDPVATPLEVSWPVSPELAGKLRYTGYVAPPPAVAGTAGAGAGEILVSAGGGAVGQPIFHAAIETARKMTGRRWRLLVGGADASARVTELQSLAHGAPIIVENARPDFRAMLQNAAASVSMCGYNTALDLMQAGTPAVLIPFDDGKEVEQGLRARALAPLPGFAVIESSKLTAETLSQALISVMDAPARDTTALRFDGAAETVRLVERMAADR
ncbi:glycosyltransferase family protein [Ruegeria marina]|uniref:Predicted glycosyl transferase n=1 Tax=Ruegeria marina TaxID=639004 RepID=A0A1G7CP76_9RHOB|nr:glycosyltransferase [Ruegeria marina]SDE40466.1 Predicted glycosyl transferase [Ruegeria marina]